MHNPTTVGLVPAILAAAPAVAQITRPATRYEAVLITERAARVALAQHGAGGGLRAQRVPAGWLFAPYPGSAAQASQSPLWLVTHDGETIDLSAGDTAAGEVRYG